MTYNTLETIDHIQRVLAAHRMPCRMTEHAMKDGKHVLILRGAMHPLTAEAVEAVADDIENAIGYLLTRNGAGRRAETVMGAVAIAWDTTPKPITPPDWAIDERE